MAGDISLVQRAGRLQRTGGAGDTLAEVRAQQRLVSRECQRQHFEASQLLDQRLGLRSGNFSPVLSVRRIALKRDSRGREGNTRWLVFDAEI
jgi:CRISPR/Cas system-associated endonuclease/helicase Cas3